MQLFAYMIISIFLTFTDKVKSVKLKETEMINNYINMLSYWRLHAFTFVEI